jgi:ketosteroid isomerase-like protein
MSQEDLNTLSARLRALEDRNAILDTLSRYSHALDYGDVAQLKDCFTSDTVRETWRPDGSVNRWEGAAGTEAFAIGHSHAPENYHKHVVTNSLIDLHGDTADVASYMFRFEPRKGQPSFIWGMGRYLDTMRREPDGRWRIVHRVAQIEDHWDGRSVLTGSQQP